MRSPVDISRQDAKSFIKKHILLLVPQSHPTMGPDRFLSPVRFLARKAEWSIRRSFTPVLFSWSHQTMGSIQFDTAVHLWFHKIIHRTPHGPRAIPVRSSYGPGTGISNVFQFLRHPYGHGSELSKTEFVNISYGRRIWPYGARTGPLRSLHRLFRGCLRAPDPYGARKLIMHASKLYGPRAGKQNSYAAARGPVSGRTIFVQNSPGTTCTGPGSVMWLRH